MNSLPIITTIIPTYRRPELLKRAIKSVLRQTYPHFQVCVYDNASGDETYRVVQEFMEQDSRVKYHCHSHNLGMMGNYLFALSQVNTPYFSILSDDDLVFPWFYEETMKGFEIEPEAGFSATSTVIFDKNHVHIDSPVSRWDRQGSFKPPEGVLAMLGRWPVPTTVIFRKEVLEKAYPDVENLLVWDCDYLMQIASQFSIVVSNKECGIFYAHDSSYSNTSKEMDFRAGFIKIAKRFYHNQSLPQAVRKEVSNTLLDLFVYAYLLTYAAQGRYLEAENSLDLLKKHFHFKWKSIPFILFLKFTKNLRLQKLVRKKGIKKFLKPLVYVFLPKAAPKKINSDISFKNDKQFQEWVKV